ncbi:MAG: AbgT family transporter [Thermoleophilaceae bacterium]
MILLSQVLDWAGVDATYETVTPPAVAIILVVMIGVGLAETAGLIGALIRKLVAVSTSATLTLIIVLLGMISSVASDAGYLVLIPLGAAAFISVGRHPLAGIAAAFAGVAAGFGVNFLITPLDGILVEITNEAIALAEPDTTIDVASNLFFGIGSTIFIVIVSTLVTTKLVEGRLGRYDPADAGEGPDDPVEDAPEVSPEDEARGLRYAMWHRHPDLADAALRDRPVNRLDAVLRRLVPARHPARPRLAHRHLRSTRPGASGLLVVLMMLGARGGGGEYRGGRADPGLAQPQAPRATRGARPRVVLRDRGTRTVAGAALSGPVLDYDRVRRLRTFARRHPRCSPMRCIGCARVHRHARFSLAEPRPYSRTEPPVNERRLRIAGLHHVTVICRDVERSVDFYRNLLGMRLVKQTVNEDDQGARHLFFGDEEGKPGTIVTCLEYPELDEGSVGRGSTHHFALSVESEEELMGWHAYLTSRGIPCTEVMDRTYFKSLYLRDPDGHIIELATAGPGLTADEPLEELGRRPVGG